MADPYERPSYAELDEPEPITSCPACGYPLDSDDPYECGRCGMTPREWREERGG